MQGSSEEQPPEPREDATRPHPALEPTEQDEPAEAARREAPLEADAHASHDDHGLAHTMPVWMLVAVLGALMGLTILTVSVTSFDLGAEGNLVVAMVIATIKAALVVTFFMHLFWDKKFHLILFLTAILFVILFLSMSITDRGEYQHNIDLYQNSTSAAK
ncbi:MAG TPA: cytochrome C oxidase subunit IV family protein [Polyangiaceae bacterium]|nr:cytochrome C oxidase subunit IV family protein [Polyangiaceae bacterium]